MHKCVVYFQTSTEEKKIMDIWRQYKTETQNEIEDEKNYGLTTMCFRK